MERGKKTTAAYHDKLIRKVLSDRKAIEEFIDSIERDLKGYKPDYGFLEEFLDKKMDRNIEVTEDGRIILPLPEPAYYDEVLQYIVDDVADEKYISQEQAEDWVSEEYSRMQYETDVEKRIESLLSQKSPGFSFKVLPREKVELVLSVPKFVLDRDATMKFIKSLGQNEQFLKDISDAIGEAAEFKVMDAIKQWLDPDRGNYYVDDYDGTLLITIPPKTEKVLFDAWQFLSDVSTQWTDPDKWARWIMTSKMKLSAASVLDVLDDAATALDSRGQKDLATEIDCVVHAIQKINKSGKSNASTINRISSILDEVAEAMQSRDPQLAAMIDEVTHEITPPEELDDQGGNQ